MKVGIPCIPLTTLNTNHNLHDSLPPRTIKDSIYSTNYSKIHHFKNMRSISKNILELLTKKKKNQLFSKSSFYDITWKIKQSDSPSNPLSPRRPVCLTTAVLGVNSDSDAFLHFRIIIIIIVMIP